MKLFLKFIVTALSLIVAISALGYFFWYKPKFSPAKNSYHFSVNKNDGNRDELIHLEKQSADIKNYIAQNKFDTNYCFLVDMKIVSGKKRFFIYNLQKDSVEKAGLVAHGSGSDKAGSNELVFSNVPQSNCTSLGKYCIGKPYNGRFGTSYKLYGLDKTNSNAYNRFVVLHSYFAVPANEVAPQEICRSLGCPMVSPSFLTELKPYIDKAKKPILLWIFY